MTRLLWLADELRAWGLDVVEVTGWRDRARPGAFDPVGCLIHHTAAPGPKDAPSLQVCIDGRRDLPGPLCQLLVARSGKVYVISAGRCNHAGAGGPLDGVKDGNGQLVGIELENDGIGEPWPANQLAAAQRATAAVLKGLGGGGSVWGHKEWAPGRKSDPTFDMAEHRNAVRGLLYPKEPTTVPTNPPSATEAALIEQWQQMLLDNGAPIGNKDGRFGRLTLEHSRKVLDHRNQLLAQVAELTKVDAMRAEALRTNADTIKRLTVERDDARAVAAGEKAEVARLQALADVATKAPALLAILQGLRAQLNEAEAKLQGLA